MQIRLASVMVDDQEKALNFYSTVLGFAKKADITMGSFRWLTVSSPEGVAGVELLEPDGLPAGQDLPEGTFRCWHPRLSVFYL
jgi:predicted enzyme related to lactoylglutathione lyase